MNPDYGARLQLQKIVMLDVADIVVVNKTDLDRAKAALSEIEHRLTQNKRKQQIVATVAKEVVQDSLCVVVSRVASDDRGCLASVSHPSERGVSSVTSSL